MYRVPQGLSLHPFQEEVIKKSLQFLSLSRSVYNACEMGLGKSITTIITLNELDSKKVLFIVPSVVKYNWEQEVNKWSTTRKKIVIIESSKDFKTLTNDFDYLIISYSLASSLAEKLKKISWDALVLDEAHYLKSSKAQRTKAILGHRKTLGIWHSAHYRIALSGTPFTKSVVDGYTLFSKMCPPAFPNFLTFAERYSLFEDTQWGRKYYGVNNAPELSKIIRANFYIRYRKEDVLTELPPKTWAPITLHKEYAFDYSNKDDMQKVIDAFREGRSPSISASVAGERKMQGLKKLPPIIEFIEDKLEEEIPLVVFAYHKEVITKLKETLAKYNPVVITGEVSSIDRFNAVKAFQEGETNLILVNIVAGGVGITLTRSSTVVFAELDWSPANISQSVDRVHRIGVKNNVTAYYFVVNDSIDEKLVDTIVTKAKDFKEVVG